MKNKCINLQQMQKINSVKVRILKILTGTIHSIQKYFLLILEISHALLYVDAKCRFCLMEDKYKTDNVRTDTESYDNLNVQSGVAQLICYIPVLNKNNYNTLNIKNV